jgi:hypothetical protein
MLFAFTNMTKLCIGIRLLLIFLQNVLPGVSIMLCPRPIVALKQPWLDYVKSLLFRLFTDYFQFNWNSVVRCEKHVLTLCTHKTPNCGWTEFNDTLCKCPWLNFIEESEVWSVSTGQILLWCVTRFWLYSVQRTVDNTLLTAARHTGAINEQTSMYCLEISKFEVINYEIIPQTHDWGNFHSALYSTLFFPLLLKRPHVWESDLREKAGRKGVLTL